MKDRRSLPFCFQEHRVVELIHARWSGRERGKAIAIYQAMTYAASKRFRDGGRDGFAASRSEIALLSGSKPATVDEYAREFIQMGILEVERRRADNGASLPSVWILLSPEGVSLETHRGSRTDTPGGAAEAHRCSPTEPVEAPPMRARPTSVVDARRTAGLDSAVAESNVEERASTTEGLTALTANEAQGRCASDRDERPEYERLARVLADLIVRNGSKRPSERAVLGWRSDIRKMVELDGRSLEQVEACIVWAQADDFWKANILSAGKLREQYDRLRLSAERDGSSWERRTPPAQAWVAEHLPELEAGSFLFHRAATLRSMLGRDATADEIRGRLGEDGFGGKAEAA